MRTIILPVSLRSVMELYPLLLARLKDGKHPQVQNLVIETDGSITFHNGISTCAIVHEILGDQSLQRYELYHQLRTWGLLRIKREAAEEEKYFAPQGFRLPQGKENMSIGGGSGFRSWVLISAKIEFNDSVLIQQKEAFKRHRSKSKLIITPVPEDIVKRFPKKPSEGEQGLKERTVILRHAYLEADTPLSYLLETSYDPGEVRAIKQEISRTSRVE